MCMQKRLQDCQFKTSKFTISQIFEYEERCFQHSNFGTRILEFHEEHIYTSIF